MSAPDPNDHGMLGERLKRAADAAAPSPIDVDEVLRRSRAARRTRRTAVVSGVAAVAGVLAITGLVLGLPGLRPTATDGQVALESAESSAVAPEAAEGGAAEDASGSRLVAPHEVNRCGAPVAPETDVATSPLAVTVAPPAGPVAPGAIGAASVTITNVGGDAITGSIDLDVALTVAASGFAVWSSGPDPDLPPLAIGLAPDESTSLPGAFEARRCDAADGAGSTAQPALEPGEYTLIAVVAYTAPDGVTSSLVSPPAPFTVG